MEEFIYLECRLSEVLGVSDSLIKKTRRHVLEDGVDFGRADDGRVVYSDEGLAKVLGFLIGSKKTARGTRERLAAVDEVHIRRMCLVQGVMAEKRPLLMLAEPWMPPFCELVVVKLTRNPGIVMCRVPEAWAEKNGGAFEARSGVPANGLQRVRVKCSDNFVRGMWVPCRWIQNNLWECTRSMPRRRGRW